MVITNHPKHINMLVRRYIDICDKKGNTHALVWAQKYVPNSAWPQVRSRILEMRGTPQKGA